MSIFRVFARRPLNLANQFDGTVIAGDNFHVYYALNQPKPPRQVFLDFIYGLINDLGCVVTYKDDANIVQTANPGGHNKQLFYVDAGHVNHPINIDAVQDNPNNDEVKMCVPNQNVFPTAQYLAEAVGIFNNPNIGDSDKEKFLLGLLLLKRCR